MFEKPAIHNLFEVLASAGRDDAVGIKVARLTGNDECSLFCAEIKGYQRVGAHYHNVGIEIYQIIQGAGEIYLGKPLTGGDVIWEKSLTLKTGDCFTIQSGTVHQLVNQSANTLIALFICPSAHLGMDRIMVKGKDATEDIS